MRPWAIIGDSTDYDGSFTPRGGTPIWFAADEAGGYLVTSTGRGVMVHDLNANPQEPPRLGYGYAPDALPRFFESDLKFYLFDIDAPAENSDLAVTVGAGQGAVVWDLSSKTRPRVHYQDYQHGKDAEATWTNRIGKRDWAFTAAGTNGTHIYDLTAASEYIRCDSASGGCGNVYAGSLPVDGASVGIGGTGAYVAVALGWQGVEIWSVADPRSPKRVLAAPPPTSNNFQTVTMWQNGGRVYLGALTGRSVGGDFPIMVYDVTCVTTNSCSATNSPLDRPTVALPADGYRLSRLTVSESGGRTFLYAGHLDRFATGDQREFLWDITDTANMVPEIDGPHELSPDNPKGLGYWGWYYARNDTGFQNFAPMEAVVRDGYVYRAAWTVLDVHELLGSSPPIPDFTWSPSPVYAGQTVQFTDDSSGGPSAWLWGFSGASPSRSQSSVENPSVVFNATGTASVSLNASNDAGWGDPVTKSFTVLDPTPAVGSVSVNPTAPLVCQQVAFTANNVSGRAPLSYAWTVKDSSGQTVGSGSGAETFTWDTSGGAVAGTYTAEVTVSNSAGSGTATGSVSLTAPGDLLINSGPSTDPFLYGTVQFRAATQGAATWTWDFGDGTQQTFTTQAEGENPVHNYTEVGTYTATLTVDNCIEQPRTQSVEVVVTEIDPLEILEFASVSQCQFGGQIGGCFTVNDPVEFDQVIGGNPDTYEYDWDGDGSWDETSSSPVTSHTYSTPGTYLPKMRVTRGTEPPITATNGEGEIIVDPAQPASISVGGPSGGYVNKNLVFSASVSNCTPSSTGWSWSTGGGELVAGGGSSATIKWSTTGTKSVSVQNSACGSASGSKLVTISTEDDGGGGDPPPSSGDLDASFSFAPQSPTTGQAVTFDGSASTGSPTSYRWDFGDGETGTGRTTAHTFATEGTFTVVLTVTAPGDCQAQVGGLDGLCTDEQLKFVTVGPRNGVSAAFDVAPECGGGQVGGGFCSVATGEEVTFSDASSGQITKRTWDFDDGTTASGRNAVHAWSRAGTYRVTLTVEGNDSSDTATKTFVVEGSPVAATRTVVLPWIAQADEGKALQQESDLFVHNPGPGPLEVQVTFRKQGLPEPDPPQVTRTLAELETLYLDDVMKGLFGRSNVKGFLVVEPVEGDAQPVVTSFNRTFDQGRTYGQAVPGIELGQGTTAREGGAEILHLVGLNDTERRLGYFGISNPTDQRLDYDLRFFDSLGRLIGQTAEPTAVAAFGQKQYQVEEIRNSFGVASLEDYRVEIVPADPEHNAMPYGANLRLTSKDPSFLRVGRTDAREVFLVGALNSEGLNNSVFRTDLVTANPGDEPVRLEVTFTSAGAFTEPTSPITLTLPAGDTHREVDVISQWDDVGAVGVLRVVSDASGAPYPVLQGESYETSNANEVYGQFMPALTADDAASPGNPVTLVGLRQEEDFLTGVRSTLWLYNPEDSVADYRIRYLDHAGNELGVEEARLGTGKFRQINPGFHPLPAGGAPEGFVVRVEVAQGKLLVAGQVVNEYNDPAYVIGR